MTVSSVLVAGAGATGCAAAMALALRGVEVSLIEQEPRWPEGDDVVRALRDLAVELRLELGLLGIVEVDSHIEAELSDGGVENFDAIVIADPETAARLTPGAPNRRVDVPTTAEEAQQVAERLTNG